MILPSLFCRNSLPLLPESEQQLATLALSVQQVSCALEPDGTVALAVHQNLLPAGDGHVACAGSAGRQGLRKLRPSGREVTCTACHWSGKEVGCGAVPVVTDVNVVVDVVQDVVVGAVVLVVPGALGASGHVVLEQLVPRAATWINNMIYRPSVRSTIRHVDHDKSVSQCQKQAAATSPAK